LRLKNQTKEFRQLKNPDQLSASLMIFVLNTGQLYRKMVNLMREKREKGKE
jgi:hypothetical protein